MLVTTFATAASVPAAAAGWYLAPMLVRLREEARLRRLCAETRSFVLTFDDGPGEDLTPRLLDLLAARGARATFFLAGFRAVKRPGIVDRIKQAGHEIGCHGQDHLNAWRISPWRSLADLHAGYDTLAPWIRGDSIYRPPYGKMNLLTWAAVRRRGARVGWWTIVAGDVNDELPSPSTAVEQIRRSDGGVVLMHDFDREEERAQFILDSTTMLLDAAEQEGWTIRTLGELVDQEIRHAA